METHPEKGFASFGRYEESRAVTSSPERSHSPVERIASRLSEQNRRLDGMVCAISDVLSKMRGERNQTTKGATPRPVRSGILGSIEDEQDILGDRLDILNELASELRELI